MSKIIKGSDCENAYKKVGKYILFCKQKTVDNLIVEITNPCDFSRLDYCLKHRNPRQIDNESANIRNVINTIFPYNLAENYKGNRPQFYQAYLEVFLKSNRRKWGTYFQRLICYGKIKDKTTLNYPNQLEDIVIGGLNYNSPQRYFINVHISSSNIDIKPRPMGGPCMQYMQFIKKPDTIDLVVVYRYQDIFAKALGNYYGLAKLLNFVCEETNNRPGNLVIHAVGAYSSSSNKKLKQLI